MASIPPPRKRKGPRWHVRLSLLALAYVMAVNWGVRKHGGDSFLLSVQRLPEKTLALFSLATHSVKHAWNSDCENPIPIISQAAAAEGIPAAYALSIARAESGFRSHSISSTGAMGLMQLMPRTARAYGVVDPFDPEDNARGAARYLKDLWTRYRGDRKRVAAAYNAGMTRVPRKGPMAVPASTLSYVSTVVKHERAAAELLLPLPIPLAD
jgi:soluble lytic murein transglycosylase-like protein